MYDCEKYMQNTISKVQDLEKLIQKNEGMLRQTIVESSQDMHVEIGGIKTSFSILEKESKNCFAGLDELKKDVKWTIKQETEKIFFGLKTE